jgi:hypothetical protein
VTEFTGQLTTPRYVLDARPDRPAASTEDHSGTWPGGRHPVPGILLLSRAHDAELDAIGALLARANVPSLRVDADRLDATQVLVEPASGHVVLNGCRIAPTVTWIRHFAPTAIPGTGHQATDQFTRESWSATASQLAELSAVTIAAGRPGILAQLRLAAAHGVPVPRTVLTNDLTAAARLIGSRLLIVKAAHEHFVEAEPGLLSGVFPVVVSSEELSGQIRPGPPLIVQEYIEHDTELRVYYVDGELHGFDVDKTAPADPWLAAERVAARLTGLPAAAARAASLLAQAMSLRFAAFDFLLRDQTAVFLEVNPNGDWRWLENKAAQFPVTSAVGRMLSRLHHGTCSRPAPFNLLAFLSADGLR